jgi:hypothetical protein
MKGKLYLAAVSMLVLVLGSQRGGLSCADDRIDRSEFSSSARSSRYSSEDTSNLLPAAPPFTEYALGQSDISAGAEGAAIATCPSGSIVVGGGYSAHPEVAFYTQYKYENGWRGDARNNSGSSKRIKVYAVCLHNVSGASVTQLHGQIDAPSGNVAQAIAICPAGGIATGGGFYAYPDGSLRVYNSSKSNSGEGWQSWAENLSASSKTLHAYGVCLSGSGGSTTDAAETVRALPDDSAYAYPTCDRGWLATGGGFAAQSDLVIYTSAGPYDGDQWRVSVQDTHPSEDRTVMSFARRICVGSAPHESLSVGRQLRKERSIPAL